MAKLECMIATPEGTVFEGEVSAVVVPAADGELGILPRHAPLVAALGCGELRIVAASGEKKRYFLSGGFVQVLGERVTVLATEAEPVEGLERAAVEAELADLAQQKPAAGSPLGDLEAYQQQVRKVQVRRKLAG